MKNITLAAVLLCAIFALWILACGTPPAENNVNAAETGTTSATEAVAGAADEFACLTGSFFQNSLHFTTEGMRSWYDAEDGFGKITGIKYDDSGCAECHTRNCDTCHAEQTDNGPVFSVAKSQDMATCLPCHSREQASMGIDEKAGTTDVHFAADFKCHSCHTGREVHGTGVLPASMRDVGYMEVACETCHYEGGKGPMYDTTTKSHSIHGEKLDCAACHVSNTMACYNCHFTKFQETGERKGNFVPNKTFLMLINYNGKVTSGNVMTLVDKKKTFETFGPYYTHSIQKVGHACADCHGNEAVRMIRNGEKIPVATYKDGKVVFWDGIIPIVAGKIQNLFLDKDASGNWIPMENPEPPLTQFSCYGTPLTDEQIAKMALPMG